MALITLVLLTITIPLILSAMHGRVARLGGGACAVYAVGSLDKMRNTPPPPPFFRYLFYNTLKRGLYAP